MAAVGPVIAVVLVAVLAFVWLGGRGGDGETRPLADAKPTTAPTTAVPAALIRWKRLAAEAFAPVATSALELPRTARDWLAGQRSDDELRQQVRRAFDDALESRDRVARLAPAPGRPPVVSLYQTSSLLYLESLRAELVAVDTPAGPLRVETDRLARRLRELADRTFDRGRILIDPSMGAGASGQIEARLPEEVPDWVAEGMAPGPPLDDAPAPPGAPPLRQASRPEQPEAAWVAAVERSGLPGAADLVGAIEAGEPAALRDLARRFVAAAERLRDVADPTGGRERSARVRLGILVQADAARAAQAGALGGSPRLTVVAKRLVLLSERLGDRALGPRASGLDPSLLEGRDP